MKSIVVAVQCPKCGYVTHKKSETLLMNGFEMRYRQEILEGTFFKKKCPICGKELSFLHPLLYVDKPHKFLLLIKSQQDFTESDHSLYQEDQAMKKRYVSKVDEVEGKIRILEDELDDRVIELIKVKLLKQYQKRYPDIQEVQYHDYDLPSRTIWFKLCKEEEDLVAIEQSTYQTILETLPLESQRFIEIDQHWAMKQLGLLIPDKTEGNKD